MKMIVGLGNPGKEYEKTRHNVGFMVLDSLGLDFEVEKKFQAMICKENLADEEVLFVKPLTYMNLSGISVHKISRYYKILPQDILVIQDDLDLPLGKYKLKVHSSSGGHNGIKSIIENLHSEDFSRLKIGVGHDRSLDTATYVLRRFAKSDLTVIEGQYDLFKQIIVSFIQEGIDKTMNQYNSR